MRQKAKQYFSNIVIILILLAGCNEDLKHSQDRSSDTRLELKKIDDFTIGTDIVMLDRVLDIPVISPDESLMAWVNSDKNEIVVTDRRGNIVSRFGKKGRGSEEFINISAIGFEDNSSIIVYDSSQDFLKKFSIDGKLLKIENGLLEDQLWIRSHRIIVHDSNVYIGVQESGSNPRENWKSKTIAKYNNSDVRLSSLFGSYDPDLRGGDQVLYIYVNSITFDPSDSKIFTTHRTLPYIQTFDVKTGERLSRFGFVSDHFKISDDKPRISDPRPVKNEKNLKQSFVGKGFVSDEYFFFHHFHWTEGYWRLRDPNLKRHFFNVFQKDKPHAFLGEIALPFTPMYVSSDNQVYLLENDNPEKFTIGIYELSIEQN